MLDAARDKAGLRDFGDDNFFPPLQALLQSLDEEANFTLSVATANSPVSSICWSTACASRTGWSGTRILDEHIAPPVVIVGLMRTGTTMLHRLMACDAAFTRRLVRDALPGAPPGYDFEGEDTRIPLAKEEVRQMMAASPDLAAIHPLEACAADEELMLLEHSFYSTVPESFAHLPGYARWLERMTIRRATSICAACCSSCSGRKSARATAPNAGCSKRRTTCTTWTSCWGFFPAPP